MNPLRNFTRPKNNLSRPGLQFKRPGQSLKRQKTTVSGDFEITSAQPLSVSSEEVVMDSEASQKLDLGNPFLEIIPEEAEISADTTASDSGSVDEAEFDETILREEIKHWLEQHGSSFYHVEATKFLAAEKRKQDKKLKK